MVAEASGTCGCDHGWVDTRTADSSGQAGGEPPRKQQRVGHGARDMLMSMLVLTVVVLGLLLLTGAVSFDPGGQDAKNSTAAPTRNPGEVLNSAARQVDFPLRNPGVPGDWHCNSAGTERAGDGASASEVVQLGWLTPDRGYLRLAQADTTAQALVKEETGAGSDATVSKQGTVSVGGVTWTKYPGRRDESAWVTSLSGVRVLITGSATPKQFHTMAAALPDATVIQPKGPAVG